MQQLSAQGGDSIVVSPVFVLLTLVRRTGGGELGKVFYQLPLILIALLHADLKNVGYITACAFFRS